MSIEIIAEVAQGFEGRPEQARLLMRAGAAGGADAVKYQLVYADELATPDYKHYDLFRSLEMPDQVWEGLAVYAGQLHIKLHLDIFGTRSLRLAEGIGVSAIKLHGTDIANLGLLQEVAQSSIAKVLLGAGGAHASEIERAIEVLRGKEIVVLLGFQGYPTPNESNQIARVRSLAEAFARTHPNAKIGFADHAPPDTPLRYALAAVAIGAGAKVLEKHLTLGQVMRLEDYESALNPDEFLEFTQVTRQCAAALGTFSDGEDFGMAAAEQSYRKAIRRHVVASRALTKGCTISPADVILKRTSAQHVLTDLAVTYQKTLEHDLEPNAPIFPADIT